MRSEEKIKSVYNAENYSIQLVTKADNSWVIRRLDENGIEELLSSKPEDTSLLKVTWLPDAKIILVETAQMRETYYSNEKVPTRVLRRYDTTTKTENYFVLNTLDSKDKSDIREITPGFYQIKRPLIHVYEIYDAYHNDVISINSEIIKIVDRDRKGPGALSLTDVKIGEVKRLKNCKYSELRMSTYEDPGNDICTGIVWGNASTPIRFAPTIFMSKSKEGMSLKKAEPYTFDEWLKEVTPFIYELNYQSQQLRKIRKAREEQALQEKLETDHAIKDKIEDSLKF